MDSGNNISEMENETVQPGDVVVTDSETTEAKPQADDTEQEEFYIEEEADQEQANTGMTKEQSYAAFRKEKEKRQRKNEQLEAEKTEKERLRKELEELKSTVSNITKGKPPTLESCDYDEEVFQQKTQEYYKAPQAKTEDKPVTESKKQSNDEADFYLYQKEQDLTQKLPSYTDKKESFVNKLKAQFNEPNPEAALAFLSDMARFKKVDIAKAIFAMESNDSLIAELYQANNNQIVIGDILERAANKVKLRTKKKIDTQPEPEITNSGPIDGSSATVKKLREQWVKDKTTASYNAYIAAKRKGE